VVYIAMCYHISNNAKWRSLELFWSFWSGELLSSLLLKSSLKSLGPFAGMLNSWYFIKFMFLVPTRNSTWTNDVMKRKIWFSYLVSNQQESLIIIFKNWQIIAVFVRRSFYCFKN
jgi:hypothetical protein